MGINIFKCCFLITAMWDMCCKVLEALRQGISLGKFCGVYKSVLGINIPQLYCFTVLGGGEEQQPHGRLTILMRYDEYEEDDDVSYTI